MVAVARRGSCGLGVSANASIGDVSCAVDNTLRQRHRRGERGGACSRGGFRFSIECRFCGLTLLSDKAFRDGLNGF